MAFPSLMSWLEFWVLPGGQADHSSGLAILFGLGKIVQFTFPLLYVHWSAPGELQLSRPRRGGIGLGVGLGLVIGLGICGLYFLALRDAPIFGATPAKLAALLANMHSNTPAVFFAMAVFISVLHSFLEEYYWRWFVFGRLQRHLPLASALVISSLAFMAHHVLVLAYYFPDHFWLAVVPFSLCVAVGGGLWAWLYHRYGSLYPPWVSHLCADAAIMVVGYDMVSNSW
jgi:membrane protease YdiL (CAAX protease family)